MSSAPCWLPGRSPDQESVAGRLALGETQEHVISIDADRIDGQAIDCWRLGYGARSHIESAAVAVALDTEACIRWTVGTSNFLACAPIRTIGR